MPSRLNVVFQVAALPDGFSGNVSQFTAALFVPPDGVVTGYIEGDFPGGQVGGTKPTTDIGVYYSLDPDDFNVLGWNSSDGKYKRMGGPPVGSVMQHVLALAVTEGSDPTLGCPANWLWLNGGRVLINESSPGLDDGFPDLYAIVGRQWDWEGDTDLGDYDDYFRLPTYCGRIPVGAGTGSAVPGTDGNLKQRRVGEYVGGTYPHNIDTVDGAPTENQAKFKAGVILNATGSLMIENMPCAVALNFMVRGR